MDLTFTGKLLLFKSLNIKSTEIYSDFRPVPSNLTFAQGAEMLKKEIATGGRKQARRRQVTYSTSRVACRW